MRRRQTLIAGWLLALGLAAVFVHLGLWQRDRGREKQARLDTAARVLAGRAPVGDAVAFDPARANALDWYATRGRFAAAPVLLLDNQLREGRVGVRVYRLFQPAAGGELLVDLGWLPMAGDRALPVPAPVPAGDVTLSGLLAPPPSPGLALGEPMSRAGDAWLLVRLEPVQVARLAGTPGQALAPRVLRLDPALPIGHARDLALLANTLPPDRHRGYALQWFGLALAVLATALVLTVRAARTPARKPLR